MRSFTQIILVAALFGIALAAPAPLPGTVPHDNAATKHPRWAPESASGPAPSPLEARAVTKNHRRAPESASGPVPSPLEARAVTKNHRRAPESQSASSPASSSQEAAAAHTRSHQARATQAAKGEYTACYE
ncbi:hypothetical protein CTheo_8187 [Ceratobasidium theobromae]|uniref:Effector protein n=1 Tax=Ceratobasidium theobromae TaxID=1582974 RepID=A0A5N5Q9N5_9AGAM|nr:hypothetical protein CTheo_8187 [Ceratobasidium theobromae]